MTWIVAIIIFELTAFTLCRFLPADRKLVFLRYATVINLILVGLTASKLADFGIGVSNVASLFYAAVFLSQFILIKEFGSKVARATVPVALTAVTSLLLLRFFLANVPTVAGNEAMSNAYLQLASNAPTIAVASFVAFYAAQQVMILATEKLSYFPTWIQYLSVCFLAQIVDSLIFFPVAFTSGDLPFDIHVLQIGAVGFVVKILFVIISVPIVWVLVKEEKD